MENRKKWIVFSAILLVFFGILGCTVRYPYLLQAVWNELYGKPLGSTGRYVIGAAIAFILFVIQWLKKKRA